MSTVNNTTANKVVLRIENLSKSFGGQRVIDDLTVDLHEGEVVLLRGQNGAGKTTLLNILSGNLEPDSGLVKIFLDGQQETFQFPARRWSNLNPFTHFAPERIAAEGVGRTWQEIRLFSTLSLQDNIAVANPKQLGENPFWAVLRFNECNRQNQKVLQQANEILANLGLPGRERSYADRISLGQSKRVAIARAIQAGSRVLFLDEPLAGLDYQGVQDILSFLQQIALERQLTLVIVEHVFNIPHILNIASTVWTLGNGKLEREERDKLTMGKSLQAADDLKTLIKKFADEGSEVSEIPLANDAWLTKIRLNTSFAGNERQRRIEKKWNVKGGDDIVLEVADLIVHRGTRLVIGESTPANESKGISFTLRRGELGILHAPNGWGKTTLLEALAGVLPSQKGEIFLAGRSLNKLSPWQRFDAGLSLLQSRDNIFADLTVSETLWLADVAEMPTSVEEFAGRKVSSLSGGQKQRVVLSAMLDNANFICGLLDEPFAALDDSGIEEVKEKLLVILSKAAVLIALPSAHVPLQR